MAKTKQIHHNFDPHISAPLDKRIVVTSVSSLTSINDEQAKTLYYGLQVYVLEDKSMWVWRPWNAEEDGELTVAIPNGYRYPDCWKTEEYDYSGKTFNFVRLYLENLYLPDESVNMATPGLYFLDTIDDLKNYSIGIVDGQQMGVKSYDYRDVYYVYQLDINSTSTINEPHVVETYNGQGRWILKTSLKNADLLDGLDTIMTSAANYIPVANYDVQYRLNSHLINGFYSSELFRNFHTELINLQSLTYNEYLFLRLLETQNMIIYVTFTAGYNYFTGPAKQQSMEIRIKSDRTIEIQRNIFNSDAFITKIKNYSEGLTNLLTFETSENNVYIDISIVRSYIDERLFEIVNGDISGISATLIDDIDTTEYKSYISSDLMRKSVYDTNDDGIVDHAANSDLLDQHSPSAVPGPNVVVISDSNSKLPNDWLYTGHGNGLDADTTDSFHASQTPSANTIPVTNTESKLINDWLYTGHNNGLDADTTDSYHASQTPTPNTIPVSGSDGKLDPAWITNELKTITSSVAEGSTLYFADFDVQAGSRIDATFLINWDVGGNSVYSMMFSGTLYVVSYSGGTSMEIKSSYWTYGENHSSIKNMGFYVVSPDQGAKIRLFVEVGDTNGAGINAKIVLLTAKINNGTYTDNVFTAGITETQIATKYLSGLDANGDPLYGSSVRSGTYSSNGTVDVTAGAAINYSYYNAFVYSDMYVAGNIYSAGSQVTSVVEKKENIKNIDSGSAAMLFDRIVPIEYDLKYTDGRKQKKYGVVADKLAMVDSRVSNNGTVDLGALVAIMAEKIKQLEIRIQNLENNA